MSKTNWKGSALLSPVPAIMVSCGNMEQSNIITIAWSGIISTQPPKLYISIRPQRYSYEIIKESGEFTVNLTTLKLVKAADYCGTYTGRKVDKFEKCRLTKEAGVNVSCPQIAESPLNMECKVAQIIPIGTHDMFIADIISVNVDDILINEKGELKLDKAGLIAYSHGEYFELGKRIGDIGFSAARRKVHAKK